MPEPREAVIGDNNPPRHDPLDAEGIIEIMRERHAGLIKRADEILHGNPDKGTKGFDGIPETISDDATAGKVGDFVKMCNTLIKTAEDERKRENRPYREGVKTVDGFFARHAEGVKVARDTATRRQTLYLQEKERVEKERRAAEEKRKREEAAALAAQADSVEDAATDPAACYGAPDPAEAERIAAAARALATQAESDADRIAKRSTTADLTRTRGDIGSTTGLVYRWTTQAVDVAKVDFEALRPYLTEDHIKPAITKWREANKPGLEDGTASLRGVTFHKAAQAQTR